MNFRCSIIIRCFGVIITSAVRLALLDIGLPHTVTTAIYGWVCLIFKWLIYHNQLPRLFMLGIVVTRLPNPLIGLSDKFATRM